MNMLAKNFQSRSRVVRTAKTSRDGADIDPKQRTIVRSVLRSALVGFLGLYSLSGGAVNIGDELIPHLDSRGQEAYTQFLFSGTHRAFSIAPGGIWAWQSGEATAESAQEKALEKCQQRSKQPCVLYAVDDDIVFNQDQWPTLWGPYKHETEAAMAPAGIELGERFPNLAFKSPSGESLTLSDFAGKVVLVHFWGSWCPPCCGELPDLQALSNSLLEDDNIEVVMLQVRESFIESKAWAKKLELPINLYDSGVLGEEDHSLTLAGGESIDDRELASTFPTTFVIDGNGLVVFSHHGAARRWSEYLSFLRDAAKNTTNLAISTINHHLYLASKHPVSKMSNN